MEALFLKLLNLSMTAGWLILAIVVLRLIFRRAPRWVFCLLWGLVAIRLICPLSLESKLSLVPDVQPPSGLTAEYRVADALIEIDPVAGETVLEEGPILIPIQGEDKTAEPSQSDGPVIVARSSAGGIIRVATVAAWVWLAGLMLMLGYALVSYLLLRRRVATATLLRENIKQSERVDSPFVLGLFRPTIYLPYAMDEADMGHVISHERAHIRRGDHWWKPLGFLILAVYWFNPLVWVAYILFCRDMELACDEKVAANLAHEERQAYSTALLHCGVRRRTVAACPLAFGEVGVKSRVKSVMHYKKPAFWVVLIALVACIVVAVCFLTVPKDDGPHTLEVTGLPAPESGKDPYADLEPAERAAAFIANADMMSYEFSPLLMYGQYVIPTMESSTVTTIANGETFTTNNLQPILERLHNFDLTTLTPIDVTTFERQSQISSLIHVGDARCRMSIWYDQSKPNNEQDVVNSALVFTFADGTMCAFDGGNRNSLITDPWEVIERSGWARMYTLNTSSHITKSNVIVTEIATGTSQTMSAFSAAYVECVFENTPRLSDPVKSEAEFPWKIEILDGGTYWYNPEEGLITPDGDYKVYAIGGFENQENDLFTMEELIRHLITGGITSSEPPSTPEPTEPAADIKPEPDTNQELEQSVWQVTVDGGLSPEDAAREMAQKIADNYMALPDGTSWKPEGVRVTNAEVFDHYWGETPQFCFRIGLDVKMTQEMMRSIHWGAWGGADEDGDGWWPYPAEVHVVKNENGEWTYWGRGTGGASVSLSDGEGLEYLVNCFWLTEGWTHDWRLPYSILDMTDEQLKELPALLDNRTEAEAKEICAHLGTMLRENDYWVHSIETLKPILGRYGTYLDA